uniref:Uncharacterized protein n=1 Tax=Anguilla anguilla TaxID=7936 RepID=A0A0E9QME0_ANGAN
MDFNEELLSTDLLALRSEILDPICTHPHRRGIWTHLHKTRKQIGNDVQERGSSRT